MLSLTSPFRFLFIEVDYIFESPIYCTYVNIVVLVEAVDKWINPHVGEGLA